MLRKIILVIIIIITLLGCNKSPTKNELEKELFSIIRFNEKIDSFSGRINIDNYPTERDDLWAAFLIEGMNLQSDDKEFVVRTKLVEGGSDVIFLIFKDRIVYDEVEYPLPNEYVLGELFNGFEIKRGEITDISKSTINKGLTIYTVKLSNDIYSGYFQKIADTLGSDIGLSEILVSNIMITLEIDENNHIRKAITILTIKYEIDNYSLVLDLKVTRYINDIVLKQ